eukprot:Skav215225  [mRNA]  locus=scaffold341:243501:245138:+ [translate_table: standard]
MALSEVFDAKAMLAQRIQGFGNVNPPPLEEETGANMAKKVMGRLGDMVRRPIRDPWLTRPKDFKEKGAVGAVKDAVADAGDILIDGIIGWIRGEPPPEEDSEKAEAESGSCRARNRQVLCSLGVRSAKVQEADPAALAQLATQQGGREAPGGSTWEDHVMIFASVGTVKPLLTTNHP